MTGPRHPHAAQLRAGITELGLHIDGARQQALLDYLDLLLRWNRAFNLTGIKDPRQMVSLNLLDSLSVLSHVGARPGDLVADVGTGAGLPGIPLALCLPEVYFILLDSNGKKTRFLRQAVAALGLGNVEIANCRAENFQSPRQIAIVITRAFSSLRQSLAWTGHLLGSHGRLLAMKGQYPEQEVAALPPEYTLVGTHRLAIPGEDCSRHLLEIKRKENQGRQ